MRRVKVKAIHHVEVRDAKGTISQATVKVKYRDSTARRSLSGNAHKRQTVTLTTYLIKIARLGGYLAPTNDSPPRNGDVA